MKKIIVLSTLLLFIMLVGCDNTTNTTYYDNGVPTYFLEPEGYIIARVDINSSKDTFLTRHYLYGYITKEDYQSYLDGTLTNSLIVKHPYETGKEISTTVDKIQCIEIGIYKDIRNK